VLLVPPSPLLPVSPPVPARSLLAPPAAPFAPPSPLPEGTAFPTAPSFWASEVEEDSLEQATQTASARREGGRTDVRTKLRIRRIMRPRPRDRLPSCRSARCQLGFGLVSAFK